MKSLVVALLLALAISLFGVTVWRVAGDIGPGSSIPPVLNVAGDIGPGS